MGVDSSASQIYYLHAIRGSRGAVTVSGTMRLGDNLWSLTITARSTPETRISLYHSYSRVPRLRLWIDRAASAPHTQRRSQTSYTGNDVASKILDMVASTSPVQIARSVRVSQILMTENYRIVPATAGISAHCCAVGRSLGSGYELAARTVHQ